MKNQFSYCFSQVIFLMKIYSWMLGMKCKLTMLFLLEFIRKEILQDDANISKVIICYSNGEFD